jgi:PAS domain S-box-containing protein
MSERKRIFLLITIMAISCLVVAGATITILYKTAITEERTRLMEIVQSQVGLIEAIARFDATYSKDYPGGPRSATLSQIINAHKNYLGFGKTGEFTLSEKVGDNIVFLISHRHYDLDKPKPVSFESKLAEPMRRALLGKSGTVIGLDYRGEKVLAAYEPIAELNLGIVAKIDMSEVRSPYVRAGLITVFFTVLFVSIGTGFFFRLTHPIIGQLEKRTLDLKKLNEDLKIEINERKQVEEELRKSERLLKQSQEIAHLGSWELDLIKNELTWSDEVYRIFGMDPKEFGATYEAFLERVHTDDRAAVKATYSGSLDENLDTYEVEHRIVKRDTGDIRVVHEKCEHIRDDTGKIVRSVGMVHDITDRKQSEKMMQESEARYRLLIDNLPNIVFKGYKDWSVYFIDDKIELLSGYKKEEFNSKKIKWIDIVVKKDINPMKEIFIHALKTDKTYVREYRIKTKTGDILWIQEGSQIVCDEKGEIEFISGAFINITEIKRLKDQFQQVQKMDAIATLAGGIAHQFNNALFVIIGCIELLEEALLDDGNLKEYVETIKNSAERMAILSAQLLAYSEGGKYQPRIISINRLLKDSLPILDHLIDLELSIETDFSKDDLKVEVDLTQMQMVLSAVVTNASEAMKDGGRIRFFTESQEVNEEFLKNYPEIIPGKYGCIVIEDDGKGMDDATKKRVFEPFFTTKFQGRGLGMAAAYGIVKNHDGWIFVDSELGVGTTVRICLPAFELDK